MERLRRAATEGRIAAEELEQRLTAALRARTYGELEATVADLPRERERGGRAGLRRGAAGWALTAARSNPWMLLFAVPVIAFTVAMLLLMTIVWAATMVVVMVLGGRPRPPRGPWLYTRHHVVYGPRRGTRSYWA